MEVAAKAAEAKKTEMKSEPEGDIFEKAMAKQVTESKKEEPKK